MSSLSVRFGRPIRHEFPGHWSSDRIHLERYSVSISAPARHRKTAPAGAALSASTWRRLRGTLTAGLFLVATLGGVGVGLQGAAVSPVAPAAAAAAVVAPAGDVVHDLPHAHGSHR
jgi:hypothetical protein